MPSACSRLFGLSFREMLDQTDYGSPHQEGIDTSLLEQFIPKEALKPFPDRTNRLLRCDFRPRKAPQMRGFTCIQRPSYLRAKLGASLLRVKALMQFQAGTLESRERTSTMSYLRAVNQLFSLKIKHLITNSRRKRPFWRSGVNKGAVPPGCFRAIRCENIGFTE